MLITEKRVKRLMMSSLYWSSTMISSLREMLEENGRRCDRKLKQIVGEHVLEILKGSNQVTYMEFSEVCRNVSHELHGLGGENIGAVSTDLEGVLFFLEQIVKANNDVGELMELLGCGEDAAYIINELGSELMGFRTKKNAKQYVNV